jgi:hypothetical protein
LFFGWGIPWVALRSTQGFDVSSLQDWEHSRIRAFVNRISFIVIRKSIPAGAPDRFEPERGI